MRDISKKVRTLRTATAQALLAASPATIGLIRQGAIPKGDPLPVARVAAVQAAKSTSQIIPYCHPLPIDFVGVEFELGEHDILVTTTVKAVYKTGVEMEALTAASVAALTLYDMMKMLDDEMEIKSVKLITKRGGKSDYKQKHKGPIRAAVLVMSDSIASGRGDDQSGKMIVERLRDEGLEIVDYKIIPDDQPQIEETLRAYADDLQVNLVMTTGGTGLSPRDCAPEAMAHVITREAPGIAEAARAYGQERTPYSMLSRGVAGIRGNTLIINLPGSKGGVSESLDALLPGVLHSFYVLTGARHPVKGSADHT